MESKPILPDERRGVDRMRTELAASFETLGGKLRLSIVDLSQSGAQLRPHSAIKVGTQGVLLWLAFEAFGEVVWQKEGYVGIVFDRSISPAEIYQTRKAIEAGEAPNEKELQERLAREWFQNFR